MEGTDRGGSFERFRDRLRTVARNRIDRHLAAKVDASDLVQETMIKAWKARHCVEGRSDGEIDAWLREILGNTAANVARDFRRRKRDVIRERSLDESRADAPALRGYVPAHGPSPSALAVRDEQMARLARALEILPPAQREAVLLRHGEGLSLEEISATQGRTPGAVALLLFRGVRRLRRLMEDGD